MPSPCPKCGGVKIEPADPGLLYWLADVFGYRLRICGRCRGYRLFRTGRDKRRHAHHHHAEGPPVPETGMAATEGAAAATPGVTVHPEAAANPAVTTNPEVTAKSEDPADQPVPDGEGGHTCPWCGSKDSRRSHRTWWERRRGSAPMYRCRQCQHRFARADE